VLTVHFLLTLFDTEQSSSMANIKYCARRG